MKKVIVFLMALCMSLGMSAQLATQNAKLFDNTYVTVQGGVATPLTFNKMFPLNPTAGVAFGKWFTPVWGAEVEGTVFFNDNGFENERPFVKAHYVGVNGLVNFTNLFCGYKGVPRVFEVGGVFGTGWLHGYCKGRVLDDTGALVWANEDANGLGVKTGLDFAFNLGKNRAHTVSVRPSVLWDVNHAHEQLYESFDKRNAQLMVNVAYTYHFKTSNCTHNFVVYDVGALVDEMNRLRAELEKKPTEVVRVEERVVTKEVPVERTVEVMTNANQTVVFFAFDSDVLTDAAKEALDKVEGTVEVVAYASPEGSAEYNKGLSKRRADVVKNYLETRGVTVTKAEGLGVNGEASGRVAIVTVK